MKFLSKAILAILVSMNLFSCSTSETTEEPINTATTRQINVNTSADTEALLNLMQYQSALIKEQGDFMANLINVGNYQEPKESFERAYQLLLIPLEDMPTNPTLINEDMMATAHKALTTFGDYLNEDWNNELNQATLHSYFDLSVNEKVTEWIGDIKQYINDKQRMEALSACENIRTCIYKGLMTIMLSDRTGQISYDEFNILWEAEKATIRKGEAIKGNIMLGGRVTQIDFSLLKLYVNDQQINSMDGVAIFEGQTLENEVGLQDLQLKAELKNPLTGQVKKMERTIYYHVIE